MPSGTGRSAPPHHTRRTASVSGDGGAPTVGATRTVIVLGFTGASTSAAEPATPRELPPRRESAPRTPAYEPMLARTIHESFAPGRSFGPMTASGPCTGRPRSLL